MPGKIPEHILGPKKQKDMTRKELEEQQDRIKKWLVEEAAREAAKKFEEGQK